MVMLLEKTGGGGQKVAAPSVRPYVFSCPHEFSTTNGWMSTELIGDIMFRNMAEAKCETLQKLVLLLFSIKVAE